MVIKTVEKLIGPGVARGLKKYIQKINFRKKKIEFSERKKVAFFSLEFLRGTHGFRQKMSAHSVQPFGRLWGTFIRMFCFIIKIDIKGVTKNHTKY